MAMNLEDVERDLRAKLDALGPVVRAELLRVLMLPDYERAGTIGAYWRSEPKTFAELLIDCEENHLRAGRHPRDAGRRSYAVLQLLRRAFGCVWLIVLGDLPSDDPRGDQCAPHDDQTVLHNCPLMECPLASIMRLAMLVPIGPDGSATTVLECSPAPFPP